MHNDEHELPGIVARLVARLDGHPGSEVILVENGSVDQSAAVCEQLVAAYRGHVTGVVAATSTQGLGHATRRGLELFSGDIVCLTASDLPFGFTDLDAVLSLHPLPTLALGSKGHPGSEVTVPPMRALMSACFRRLREAVVGMRAADTQGSLFLSAPLARSILPHLQCGDFLIATEVVCWADRLGVPAVEVPVVYHASGHSTVSPVRDSLRMASGLFALRRRLHAAAIPERAPLPT